MKRCPTCSRTYASDEFTFCLDDGALLSAPYDPDQGETRPAVRRSEAPRTEVLPAALTPTAPSAPVENEPPAIPTMAAPAPAPVKIPLAPEATPIVFRQPVTTRSKLRLIYVIAPLLLLALVGGVVTLVASQCPALTVYCSPGDNLAGCVTDGESSWHKLIVRQTVTWQTSIGKVTRVTSEGAVIDTAGFAGQEVTVTVAYSTWLCSTTASKSFTAK